MTFRTVLFTMTALAMVSGCSKGGSQANNSVTTTTNTTVVETNTTTAPAAGNSANNAAPVSTGPVDQAFLVGRWGVNGDCSQVMEFKADGTATPPEGSTYAISGSTVKFEKVDVPI